MYQCLVLKRRLKEWCFSWYRKAVEQDRQVDVKGLSSATLVTPP
jgi:hypothetical protein